MNDIGEALLFKDRWKERHGRDQCCSIVLRRSLAYLWTCLVSGWPLDLQTGQCGCGRSLLGDAARHGALDSVLKPWHGALMEQRVWFLLELEPVCSCSTPAWPSGKPGEMNGILLLTVMSTQAKKNIMEFWFSGASIRRQALRLFTSFLCVQ